MEDDTIAHALSVRQPYAELIMKKKKKIEYRTIPTNIRGRVYIYASQKSGASEDWAKLKMKPGDLPVGVLIGTVVIFGCSGPNEDGYYEWHLIQPERLPVPQKPTNQPQPVWFKPF